MKNYKNILMATLVVLMLLCKLKAYGAENLENTYSNNEIFPKEHVIEAVNQDAAIGIDANAAILYDKTYDKILYQKNIETKLPNASTTKILTAIVAYENASMEDMVEIGERAANIGGSTIGLRKGNKVKMEDLMKGMLMASGNDAAIAISEHVAGSVEAFCEMMNKRARELGATSTNFVTPHGLDKDEHFSSVQDLLIFTKKFMEIPFLMEIANTTNATIKIDNYEKTLKNTNEMLSIYEAVNGIKTGFTGKAGRCLVTSINSGDRELITIVLGCESKNQRTVETKKLINYGFDAFEEVDIFENMKKNFEIRVEKSLNEKYEIIISGKKNILLKKGEKARIKYDYNISHDLVATLEKGDNIGNIEVKLDDEKIAQIPIVAPYNVEKKDIFQYFSEIMKKHRNYIEIHT